MNRNSPKSQKATTTETIELLASPGGLMYFHPFVYGECLLCNGTHVVCMHCGEPKVACDCVKYRPGPCHECALHEYRKIEKAELARIAVERAKLVEAAIELRMKRRRRIREGERRTRRSIKPSLVGAFNEEDEECYT